MCLALYDEDRSEWPICAEQVQRTLWLLNDEPVRGRAVVLDVQGQCCGYALLISYWSNELRGEICTIDELYVRPPWRNQGNATMLVQSLVSGTGPWPGTAVALELEITPRNTRALALYRRLGFAVKRNATLRLVSRQQT